MSRLSVSMSGGAPWGFRLYGGGTDPLVVAKLRKRSKASDAGLVEGDVLLAINQYTTQNMSHPVAMALVDQARGNLSFEVLRGSSGESNAVHSALQTLGSQYSAPPTSAPPAPSPVPQAVQAPPRETQAPQTMQNGFDQGPSVVRQQETFNDGNTQRQVTTETKTEKFGGTSLTKVTRQEVSSSSYGAPSAQKPGTWAPVGYKNPTVTTARAPPGLQVNQNPDQSITLTLDSIGDKENRAPAYIPPSQQATQQSMFRIQKVQTQQPKAIWQPSFIPDLPQRDGPENTNLMDDMPESAPYQPLAPAPVPAPEPARDMWDGGDRSQEGRGRPLLEQSEDEYARMMLHMIMHGPQSPNTMYMKKKKVYADSAFFDDTEHKYPTIEEQIKMARKVALSLESPANKKARGHTMFIKRKEKAYRWVTGEHGEAGFQEVHPTETEDNEEKYYKLDPWKTGGHTWQPSLNPGVAAAPPPPPSLSDFNWNKPMYKAPTLPFGASKQEKEEKSKAMSQEEFERMCMFEQKVQHNKISPMVSFKLAEDLHGLKGKGAKLFAKRKANSEAWVVGGGDQTDSTPRPSNLGNLNNPAFLMKLTGGMMPPPQEEVESPPSGPAPASRPRLQAMIDPPKAAMTPWDAAASYGQIDKAFDHLDDYMKMKRGDMKGQIASKLCTSAKSSSTGQGVMPEFSRKIQPWDQPAQGPGAPRAASPPRATTPSFLPSPTSSTSSLSLSAPKLKPWSSTTALNRTSMSTASVGFNQTSTTSSSGGFRPVKFKAPGSSQFGRFDTGGTLWQRDSLGHQPGASRSSVTPVQQEISEADGFCDL